MTETQQCTATAPASFDPSPPADTEWTAKVTRLLGTCDDQEQAIMYALGVANMSWDRPLDAGNQHTARLLALGDLLAARLRDLP